MTDDSIELFLRPTLENVKEGMGFEADDEEADEDAMYQQGYESEMMAVYDDDPFEIPIGYEAEMPDDEEFYVLDLSDDPFYKEDFVAYTLAAGRYRLERAENVFWRDPDEEYRETIDDDGANVFDQEE